MAFRSAQPAKTERVHLNGKRPAEEARSPPPPAPTPPPMEHDGASPRVEVQIGPGVLTPHKYRVAWSLRRLERRIEHQVHALIGRNIHARVTIDTHAERPVQIDDHQLGVQYVVAAEVHKDAWKVPRNPLTYAPN